MTDTISEGAYEERYADPPAPAPLATRPEPATIARATPTAPMQPAERPQPRQPGPRTSEDTAALFAALCKAQMGFADFEKRRPAKVRSKQGGEYSYKFANLSDVCAAVMPSLKEHGIFPMQIPMGDRVYVRLVHGESGQWIEGGLPLVLPDYGANDTQRLGSAITYTRRYLLLMMLGIVAMDEDDDGASAHAQGARR